jgi:hypothetical protein
MLGSIDTDGRLMSGVAELSSVAKLCAKISGWK